MIFFGWDVSPRRDVVLGDGGAIGEGVAWDCVEGPA
jgi:hypothetical protein